MEEMSTDHSWVLRRVYSGCEGEFSRRHWEGSRLNLTSRQIRP